MSKLFIDFEGDTLDSSRHYDGDGGEGSDGCIRAAASRAVRLQFCASRRIIPRHRRSWIEIRTRDRFGGGRRATS